MKKRWILLVLTAFLSACVSFLPSHDQAIYKRLESAISEIEKIRTAISLPYQHTFSEIETYYISAESSLVSAEEMATSRVAAVRGRIPERPAGLLAQAIGNCRQALQELRHLHQTQGIDADDFREARVIRTCTIPQMMEARLKRG